MGQTQIPLKIPRQLTTFIGRDEEIQKIAALLEAGERLITVTGPGGIGKTRLAIEVGNRVHALFPGGVFMVELATVTNPDVIPAQLATLLNRQLRSDESLATVLQNTIDDPVLLILDNCEHLIETCAMLSQHLIRDTDCIHILATSRESLSVQGETIRPVAPMRVPKASQSHVDRLLTTEAVQLFVNRASLSSPSFVLTSNNAKAVRDICRHLEGIPLAIELAAARIPVLSPRDLLQKLKDRFDVLRGSYRGAPPRQQTLRALFDWSYELMSEHEQVLWQRLSIFASGFSLAAAEEVVSDERLPQKSVLDTLTRLVDQSIVTVSHKEGITLYHMLSTLREYGREELKSAQDPTVFRVRHKDYYVQMMLHFTDRYFNNPAEARIPEMNNVMEAFEFSISSADAVGAMKIAAVLAFIYQVRGEAKYGYETLKRVLHMPDSQHRTKERALALTGIGFLAHSTNRTQEAISLLTEATQIAEENRDLFALQLGLTHLGMALPHKSSKQKAETLNRLLTLSDNWIFTTDGQCLLSQHYWWRGDVSPALDHAMLAVDAAQEHQATYYYALALGTLGTMQLGTQDYVNAVRHLEAAVESMGHANHVINLCDFLLPLSRGYQLLGRTEKSISSLKRALTLQMDMDLDVYVNDKSIAWLAWTFVICAGYELMPQVNMGASIVADELLHQPKQLRHACEKILQEVREQQVITPAAKTPLSRREWIQTVLHELSAWSQKLSTKSDVGSVHGLTEREVDVLRSLSDGKSNKDIANEVNLSEGTVRVYLSRVYSKLTVTSRSEAVLEARRLGIIES